MYHHTATSIKQYKITIYTTDRIYDIAKKNNNNIFSLFDRWGFAEGIMRPNIVVKL